MNNKKKYIDYIIYMDKLYLIIGVVIVVVFIICYTMPKKSENFKVDVDPCRKKCLSSYDPTSAACDKCIRYCKK